MDQGEWMIGRQNPKCGYENALQAVAFRVGCAQLFLNYDDPLGNVVHCLHNARGTFMNIELVAIWPWIPRGCHIL